MSTEVTSIHSHQIGGVHDVPMNVIIRPFPPEVNEEKVKSLMNTLQVRLQKSFHKVFFAIGPRPNKLKVFLCLAIAHYSHYCCRCLNSLITVTVHSKTIGFDKITHYKLDYKICNTKDI